MCWVHCAHPQRLRLRAFLGIAMVAVAFTAWISPGMELEEVAPGRLYPPFLL